MIKYKYEKLREIASEYFFKKHKKNMDKLKKQLPNMIGDYIKYCNTSGDVLQTEEDKWYAVSDGFIRKELSYMIEDIVREIHKKGANNETR